MPKGGTVCSGQTGQGSGIAGHWAAQALQVSMDPSGHSRVSHMGRHGEVWVGQPRARGSVLGSHKPLSGCPASRPGALRWHRPAHAMGQGGVIQHQTVARLPGARTLGLLGISHKMLSLTQCRTGGRGNCCSGRFCFSVGRPLAGSAHSEAGRP